MKFLIVILIMSFQLFGSEMMEAPQYLYKVLPERLWLSTQKTKSLTLSADDQEFIHLAKEDQISSVVKKFFANVPKYVVLKLDTSKLQGRLVLDNDKYYHLYGRIPFDAIVEANMVFCEPSCCDDPLDIVEVGEVVLRQQARELSLEEIQSPEIQELIKNMVSTMREAPGVGLAAPQIGQSIQLVVVEDMDQSHLTENEIAERERTKVPLHVIINPRLFIEETDTAFFVEGCLSVPNIVAAVPRAKAVRVECLNEKGEPTTIHAKGWYARILQHEIDHLKGTLFIDKANLKTMMTHDNYGKHWRNIKDIERSLAEK